MQQTPLIVLSIELRQGHSAQLIIFNESDPFKLAQEFVSQNGLPTSYVNPIKQNIIKQMCLYDALKNSKETNQSDALVETKTSQKENKSPIKQVHEICDTKIYKKPPNIQQCKTPEKKRTQPQWNDRTKKKAAEDQDTDKEFDIYERLYQHSKQMDNKKYLKYQQEKKKKEQVSQNDPNLTFKPVINEYSRKLLYKKALRPKSPNLNTSPHQQQESKSPFKQVTKEQNVYIPKSPRLNTLYKKINPEVKISILENQQSFSEQINQSEAKSKLFVKTHLQPVYTEDQIENSFSDFMKQEFKVNKSRG